jgi:hypothetical protein
MGNAVGTARRTAYVLLSDAMPTPHGTAVASIARINKDGNEATAERREWLHHDALVHVLDPWAVAQ